MSENSLDHDTVMDLDDLAQNDASSFLQQDLEKRIAVHLETLQHLEEIPFQNTDTIKPGAIVKINGKKIIIATAKRPFEYQGERLEAISPSAPIYKEMKGKKVGDTYNFHGEIYKIEEVS
jgi:transcription elongation GreA/GreB family factor